MLVSQSEIIEDDYEYPEIALRQKPKKPTAAIYMCETTTLDQLRGAVLYQIKNGPLNYDHAIAYLYKVFLERKELVTETWISFGVEIAKEGSYICAWDLLDMKLIPKSFDFNEESLQCDSNTDIWLPEVIIFFYHVGTQENENRKIYFSQNIFRHRYGKYTNKYELYDIYGVIKKSTCFPYCNLNNIITFNILIAALDMFYYKYDKSMHSSIRATSYFTRYAGCAGLYAYKILYDCWGAQNHEEILRWMWCTNLKVDICRITKVDDEIGRSNSYFPYHLSMGIVKKSPYSSKQNSALYYFAHLVCAMLGNVKSYATRIIFEGNTEEIFQNAALMAFASRNRIRGTIEEHRNNTSSSVYLPQIASGSDWRRYCKTPNFKPPEAFNDWFHTMQTNLTSSEMKPASIGEDLKNRQFRCFNQ